MEDRSQRTEVRERRSEAARKKKKPPRRLPGGFSLLETLFVLSHAERIERGLVNRRGGVKAVVGLVGGEGLAR